jgi:flagellar protein FliL
MNKKKILLIVLVVLLGGGYVAKGKLMPPKVVKLKVAGEVYILPKQFTLNLQDGRYATLTAALVLAAGQTDGATAEAATSSDATVGTLPEEAVIRSIITNTVTGDTSSALIDQPGREHLEQELKKEILTQTDVKITDVLFTDVAVQ